MCFVKRYVILPFQWSPQCETWKWHTAGWLQGVCLCRADEDAADIARRCADHRGKDAVICASQSILIWARFSAIGEGDGIFEKVYSIVLFRIFPLSVFRTFSFAF